MSNSNNRKFVCIAADLERFEQRLYIKYGPKWPTYMPGMVKQYARYLVMYGVAMDEFTQAAVAEFKSDKTIYNLHMVIHHCIWQLLKAYLCGEMRVIPNPKVVELWKQVTQDCIKHHELE